MENTQQEKTAEGEKSPKPDIQEMHSSETRDFYSAMATGIGGAAGLTVSVLTEPDPTLAATYTLLGALGSQVVYIKARQIYENLKGLEWKLEEIE